MLKDFVQTGWQLLNVSSFWLVASFILCGLLHIVLRPEFLQQSLGNTKLSSLVKATISGMLLPICSCGVVPLALSLYYSGAYLGPTLAFLVATPIINPAAVLLAFALLGPQLTIIYVITGFALPMLIGVIGNKWGKNELVSPMAAAMAAAAGANTPAEARPKNLTTIQTPWTKRIYSGLDWGFHSLGMPVSRYVLVGILFAALLLTIIPMAFIQDYLSSPALISLIGVAILGAVMYVCAVGHIPFIAALIAAGVAPGAAITFLLCGTATNLPELISIYKLIGKRTIVIYTVTVVSIGLIVGYLTNVMLPGFTPVFDLSHAQNSIDLANKMSLAVPAGVEYVCSLIILAMGLIAWWPICREWFRKFGQEAASA